MWNYIIDSGNVVGALGEDEADCISGDILEYLGNFHKNHFSFTNQNDRFCSHSIYGF